MEIEYIYPDPDDEHNIKQQIKQLQKENTMGCLIMALMLLGGLFILLAVLPVVLMVVGWSIVFISVYIVYKAYVEDFVLGLIQKLKNRRK